MQNQSALCQQFSIREKCPKQGFVESDDDDDDDDDHDHYCPWFLLHGWFDFIRVFVSFHVISFRFFILFHLFIHSIIH